MPQDTPDGLLDYDDYDAFGNRIYDNVRAAVESSFPVENQNYRLRIEDVDYTGPQRYSVREQKRAILEGRSLTRKLTGRYVVEDVNTGQEVSRTGRKTLINVPYYTNRGTFIRNGMDTIAVKQFRLRPNVYTRITDDGNIESQFNLKSGTGSAFRVYMEPSTGVFYYTQSGRKVPLLPVLLAAGTDPAAIKAEWGKDLYDVNTQMVKSPHAIKWLQQFQLAQQPQQKQASETGEDQPAAPVDTRPSLLDTWHRAELDPETTAQTLGEPHVNVTPRTILAATRRILQVGRGESDIDDRDSLEFQTIHDMSDFLPDKIRSDQNRVMRDMLWKLGKYNGDASRIPAGLLNAHVDHLFNESGMTQYPEEINPLEIYDQNKRVVRLGEGGIVSVDSVPKESRNVSNSYLNFVDPVRAPESLKIGVDMKLARNVRKGPNNTLVTQFIDARTGKPVWASNRDTAKAIIGFPDFMKSTDPYVPAMVRNKGIFFTPRKDVDYVVPTGDDMFSDLAQTVALKSGVKGMRLLMGSKFAVAAVPLVTREAPFVQTLDHDGESIYKRLGRFSGAVHSPVNGTVKSVYKDHAIIVDDNGEEHELDLYDNLPHSRKTFIRSIPKVKAGQRLKKGDLVAASNFTDDNGNAAPGRNLRVGYLNYDGKTFEDAIVISESAARDKLTSEHMYNDEFETSKEDLLDKRMYRSLFPTTYSKEQLNTIDDSGAAKPGTVLRAGDPVFLAVRERAPGPGTMGRRIRSDISVTWQHPYPGVVVDTSPSKNGMRVYIRANLPMEIGDKLTNSQGGKGVISAIVPDDEMPRDASGRPLEVLMSPLGVISRTNSSQLVEASLGKIAEKTGKIYKLPGFMDEDLADFAQKELAKHGMSDTEDLYDPVRKKTIPKVFTGNIYMYKLQHMAEGKGKSRATAEYTADDQPAKGGKTGAKHLGVSDVQALLGYGAGEVLKDLKLVKGQRNDAFWRQMKLGQTPVMPDTPLVYDKFRNLVKAAGVQFREEKDADSIFAMTNKEAEALTGNRKLENGETYGVSGNPMRGGLFDPDKTGSLGNGASWSYIELPEPMPNPVMQDPLRRILGLKIKEFENLVAGRTEVDGKRGGHALMAALSRVNLQAARTQAANEVENGPRSRRDDAVKKLMYIDAMIRQKKHPTDFMMTRVPVLPPKFRPITRLSDMTMVADPNYMYKAMVHAIEDLRDSKDLPHEDQADARGEVYKTYQALVGLVDPVQPELQQKNVGGILESLFGKGSPKLSFVQRKLIGTNMDFTGLGVAVPNPSLKLHQVGMPEKLAWDLYEPFAVRYLVQRGMKASDAAKAVADKSKPAYMALQEVIKDRPVLINRAPTLHRYSILALEPVLTKGSTVQVSPQIVKPLGLDYDGNCVDFSSEIILTLPSSALPWLVNHATGEIAKRKEIDTKAGSLSIVSCVSEETAVVRMPIGAFPKAGTPAKDKNGADVYPVTVPVKIQSYDPTTGAAVWCEISQYTVELDCPSVTVKTRSRSVVVSSNESLAVFDHVNGGLKKHAPAESIGSWCAVLRKDPTPFGSFGSAELGWTLGMFASDGWISHNTVGLAKLEDAKRNTFVTRLRRTICANFISREYREDTPAEDKHGKSVKVHCNGTELVAAMKAYDMCDENPAEGRQALTKRLPAKVLLEGSEEFLWGMLSGLFDGDGCFFINTSAANPRFGCRVSTSSSRLRDDICRLFFRLGLRYSVTTAPATAVRGASYTIYPSAVDMRKNLHRLTCIGTRETTIIEQWRNSQAPCKDNLDIIPLTQAEMKELADLALVRGDKSTYSTLRRGGKAPFATRTLLEGLLVGRPVSADLLVRLSNPDVIWEPVKTVTDAGRRDVYDFEVAGTKVFAVNNGLIIYDTLSFSVPVGDKAVKQAYELMTPQKNLISARDDSPLFMPSNEYLQGLYYASKDPTPGNAPKVFTSKEEALKAYKEGKIRIDDPVVIRPR